MTDKTQPAALAEITAPISVDLRGIDGGALPAPITYMTEDRACKWAWDQVREEVGTEGWTAGDSCTFYGFFLWGWNYRGQYEAQRLAAPPAPAAVAVPEYLEHIQVGRLPTMNQDEYPGLGDWWVQLRIGSDGDEVLARVYGNSPEEAHARAEALAAVPAQAVAEPVEVDLPDVEDMAHSAVQEALSYGVSHDVFHRWMRAVMDKTVQAMAAAPAREHATQLAGQELGREFRKKPVVIQAMQWLGDNLRDVIAFTDGPPDTRSHHAGMKWEEYQDLVARDGLKIFTLEGKMNAAAGDWIIRGVKGELYPCKPDIFEATYEDAAAPAQAQEDASDAVERAERYEDALRHIAENAFANKDWTFAQLILNGHSIDAARAAQGGAA